MLRIILVKIDGQSILLCAIQRKIGISYIFPLLQKRSHIFYVGGVECQALPFSSNSIPLFDADPYSSVHHSQANGYTIGCKPKSHLPRRNGLLVQTTPKIAYIYKICKTSLSRFRIHIEKIPRIPYFGSPGKDRQSENKMGAFCANNPCIVINIGTHKRTSIVKVNTLYF